MIKRASVPLSFSPPVDFKLLRMHYIYVHARAGRGDDDATRVHDPPETWLSSRPRERRVRQLIGGKWLDEEEEVGGFLSRGCG